MARLKHPLTIHLGPSTDDEQLWDAGLEILPLIIPTGGVGDNLSREQLRRQVLAQTATALLTPRATRLLARKTLVLDRRWRWCEALDATGAPRATLVGLNLPPSSGPDDADLDLKLKWQAFAYDGAKTGRAHWSQLASAMAAAMEAAGWSRR